MFTDHLTKSTPCGVERVLQGSTYIPMDVASSTKRGAEPAVQDVTLRAFAPDCPNYVCFTRTSNQRFETKMPWLQKR